MRMGSVSEELLGIAMLIKRNVLLLCLEVVDKNLTEHLMA